MDMKSIVRYAYKKIELNVTYICHKGLKESARRTYTRLWRNRLEFQVLV